MWSGSRGNSQAASRTRARGLLAAVALTLLPSFASAQAPAPPSNLVAVDHPWDNATRVDLTWTPSPDGAAVQGYVVRRRATTEEEFAIVDIVPPNVTAYTTTNLNPEGAYLFEVSAQGPANSESVPAVTTTPVAPTMEWFDGTRLWFLITLIVMSGSVIAFILLARRGQPLKLRRIAGLEAVDDAVGRATEMGRPCIYINGVSDMNNIQTIAGLTIMSRVARTAAEYDAKLEIPTNRPLVMVAAQEAVQAAYLSANRPEAYNPESIYCIPDEQFAFVAHVQGTMVREKPAACFYMGSFFAESLLLAETGNSVGAIQIAGTAEPAQLPFFVAACDYTLIGEEFFAASAYLSGEPDQLGSLKGQDVGKVIVAAGILLGVIGTTIVALTGSMWVESLITYFMGTVLT